MISRQTLQIWGMVLNLVGIAGAAWAFLADRRWFAYFAVVWMAGLIIRFLVVPWTKAPDDPAPEKLLDQLPGHGPAEGRHPPKSEPPR